MACGDPTCGKSRPVMVQMAPGRGSKEPWELCASCWADGARPNKLGNVTDRSAAPRPKKGDKMGKSLTTGETYVATGEVIIRGARVPDPAAHPAPERSAAKEDVGSFDAHPNAPGPAGDGELAYTGGVQYVPDGDGYW